jgi:hypothetical protein
MEDIYCDFDVVFDELFDMIHSNHINNNNNHLSLTLKNVNISLIEDDGDQGFANFISAFENVKEYYSEIGKVLFEYISSYFIVLSYDAINEYDVCFNIKVFTDINNATKYYTSLN